MKRDGVFGKVAKLREFLFHCVVNLSDGCVDVASVIFYPFSKLLSRKGVRILCYHRVCDLPETKDDMRIYNVPPAAFAQQMAFLSQNGFQVITLEQFVEYKQQNRKPPPKTVIITFDDGYRDNYLNAFPILEESNFKATFFVVTDYINSDRIFHWLNLGKKSLSHYEENKQYWLPFGKDDILSMSNKGACFGSHTKTHCNLKDVDESRAMEELRGSKECLEKKLLKPVRCFCYPFGGLSELIKNWVKAAGYDCAVSVEMGCNTLNGDFFNLRRTSISGQDSYAKFKRKVEGAYDWVGYLIRGASLIKRIMFRMVGRG